MFYTYILRSIEHPEQRYIGHTADLRERLKKTKQRRCASYCKILHFSPFLLPFCQ